MGDVLHALPAVTALHHLHPAALIGWVVDPRWAPLLAGSEGDSPVVSRLHLADTRLWSRAPWSAVTRRSVLNLRQDLRQPHYAAAIDMQGTLRSAVLGRLAAAPRFTGYADPREPVARWFYRRPLPRTGRHVVEQGAALLGQSLGVALEPTRTVPLPRLPEAERWATDTVTVFSPGQPFALLAPTAGWGAKQWPATCFGALAAALRDRGLTVLVNAAHPGDPVALAVVAASSGAAHLVAGGVAGLVALTRRAALAISGDSGPIHLAAALGTPLVALFGPTDPERNGPWGAGPMRVLRHPASPTTYKRNAAPDPGLIRIDVQTALRAALEVLQTSPADNVLAVGTPEPLQE